MQCFEEGQKSATPFGIVPQNMPSFLPLSPLLISLFPFLVCRCQCRRQLYDSADSAGFVVLVGGGETYVDSSRCHKDVQEGRLCEYAEG